jgi:hypothetical protein
MTNEKERLLCYAAGILGSTLANPGNIYPPENLIKQSIRAAQKLIDVIYDDAKLSEILKNDQGN